MNKYYCGFISLTSLILSTACLFAQWEPDVRLTYNDSISSTFLNYAWCIGAAADTIHIVWDDTRDGHWEVYYIRSLNAGSTWELDTRLSDYPDCSMHPAIGVSGSNVHVIWSDERDGNQEIYYKRSTDSGLIWGADTRLTSDTAVSASPCLAVFGDTIHIVWHDQRNGNMDIYYKRSTDRGTSWSGDIRLTQGILSSLFPSIAVSETMIHVVWYSDLEIYYMHSTDGGMSWGPEQRLTYSPFLSLFASVAVSGDIVHIVWHDQRSGNMDIYYKRSTDHGITWFADTGLTADLSSSNIPALAACGNFAHVVWYDNRMGNYEIYYKCSYDNGISWSDDIRLTDHAETSKAPCITLSGSCIHLVWLDERDGNYEIYYKRDLTGNAVSEADTFNTGIGDFSVLPSPFHKRVTLKYSIVNNVNVSLNVYDVSGRLIKTLVDEEKTIGTYSVQWDASPLRPGVYFIAFNDHITKKLVKAR